MTTTHPNEIKAEAAFMREKARLLVEEATVAGPGKLSEIAVELTSIKAYFSEKIDHILVSKAAALPLLQDQHGSVASAKLMWAATPEGTNEILLKGIIGRIKDSVSSINKRINVKSDEARGLY